MMQLVFKFCFCLFDYFSDVILINCTGLCLSVQKIVISSVTINVHRETLNTLSVFTDAFCLRQIISVRYQPGQYTTVVWSVTA